MITVAMNCLLPRGARAEAREVVKTDELDGEPPERLTQSGGAQRAQLGLALDRVTARIARLHVARVAGHFRGGAFFDLLLQHPHKTLHTDLLQVGLASPLAVEAREGSGF